MSKTVELARRCGKVEVNLAPLLMILGAAMREDGPDIESMADLLFADLTEDEK